MQSRGSELGSVGLAKTQVFFVWPDLSPLALRFYIVKLGFKGVYIFYLFLL